MKKAQSQLLILTRAQLCQYAIHNFRLLLFASKVLSEKKNSSPLTTTSTIRQAVIKADDTRYQSLDQKIYQLSCTQENNRAPEICAEVWYAEASPGMVNSLKFWTSKACSSQQKSHEHPKSLWHKRVAKGSPMKALTSRAKIYQTRTTRYLLGILRWHHDRNFWLQVANSMMGTLLSTIFCYQVAVMLLTPPCSKHLLDKTYSKIKQELQI